MLVGLLTFVYEMKFPSQSLVLVALTTVQFLVEGNSQDSSKPVHVYIQLAWQDRHPRPGKRMESRDIELVQMECGVT